MTIHDSVARDFGDDARSRDGERSAVAFDEGKLLDPAERGDGSPVDQQKIGRFRKSFDRFFHREVRGAGDVEAIDLGMLDDADGPGDVVALLQLLENFLTGLGRKLFGIVERGVRKIRRKNDSAGNDRTGKGSAADFINAGDAASSLSEQLPLKLKPVNVSSFVPAAWSW